MVFDIRLLDNLSYDEVEPLLEDYIEDAIAEFVESATGQAHIRAYPEGGQWIGSFVEMAYLYGEFTLPHMTKANVQQVIEYILPRKLTLLDPSEADDAIPELVAFWTFLKQDYKLRNAGAIVKYLLSIQNKFKKWMFDPARGGIAKNFMMQGAQSGYDMSTMEGIEAFKEIYNQQIQANPPSANPAKTGSAIALPPEMQEMLARLGIQLPETGQPANPLSLVQEINRKLERIEAVLAEDDDEDEEYDDDDFVQFIEDLSEVLPEELLAKIAEEEFILPEEAIAFLESQTISETEPGTLLRDFQTILDFIGEKGVPVTNKRYQFSLNLLAELNQRLSNPIQIALKRPQQKSYPNIHGLYLLLRATGIVKVVAKGKQQQLMLNPAIYESWRQLNPSERYFTLLEAWLVRASGEMLGEDDPGPYSEGDRCMEAWTRISGDKQKRSYPRYADQESLADFPGFHNVALMEMFGFLTITSGKPGAGKGWRIRSLETRPLGDLLMALVGKASFAVKFVWPSATDPTVPFRELQPMLQPYFPQWQKSLAVPSREFRPGRHIFKVSLGEVWRRIAISGEATLADFRDLILDSVDFDSDYLDSFLYTNELGCTVEVSHPRADGIIDTDCVKMAASP